MTETDPISTMFETEIQDSVHGPEYLLLFNKITGSTFFINRFPNMINSRMRSLTELINDVFKNYNKLLKATNLY